MKINRYLIFNCILVCTSCGKVVDTSFTHVADYYAGDSLKTAALEYLEESVRYHYGVPRHIIDTLGNPIEVVQPTSFETDSAYKVFLDSMGFKLKTGWAIKDMDAISDDFLKETIELAFDSWQKPWAKGINFQDFCKYILPYRNVDEELSNWRRTLKERYETSIIDSVNNPESIKEVAEYVMREIRRDVHYSTSLRKIYDSQMLTPDEMIKISGLECRACAHYTTLAFRACGIPCSMIELHWRFTEVPHSSVMVPAVGNNERAFRINVGDSLIYMGEPKDTMAVWRAWAYSYTPNAELLEISKDERIPPSFTHPVTREDITDDVSTTQNFVLPLPGDLPPQSYVFLCRFSDWDWYAIREGKVIGDSVYFHNATIHQWYRLGFFENEMKTFGDTFTLLGNGSVLPLNNSGDSIVFNIEYGYNPKDIQRSRNDTLYYWGERNMWTPICLTSNLRGHNKKTDKDELYDRLKHNQYDAIYYSLKTKQPIWTVFYNNHMGRPIGFISKDSITNKAVTMES